MAPHGRKNVVKLNVDGREGKEPRDQHLEWSATVPRNFCWNLPSDLCRPGRSIEVRACISLGHASSKDSEGECQEDVKCRHGQDCCEWKSTSGSVCNGNRIHPNKDSHNRGREECRSGNDALHPVLATHLSIKSD